MSKSVKVSDKERERIAKLFGKGLTGAGKNPEKYWEEERKRGDAVKPWKGFGKPKTKAKSATVVRVAYRYLLGMEFATPEAYESYLEEHPAADRSLHTVKKQKDEKKPAKEKASEAPPSRPLKKPSKVSRVGIPGDEVLPPPKLPRLTGLKPDEKEMESKMNTAIEKDPAGAAAAFHEVAKANNWVFETDGAKALMPEWTRHDLPPDEKGKVHPERAAFRGKYNAVLHQGANAIAKRAFVYRLDEIEKLPEDKRRVLVTSGGVACHGRGTPILMFDGSIRAVEDVTIGDLVMGPDSSPRTVQATTCGLGPMYLVRPKRGDPFTVNDEHVLSLKYALGHGHSKVKVVNLTVREVLDRGKRFRKGSFLYRTGVTFQPNPVPLDPYFLGLWLGDGTSSAPHITSADPEVEEFLQSFAARYPRLRLRKTAKKNNKAHIYALSLVGKSIGKSPDRNPLTMALETLGVLKNKHIPRSYLVNDEQVRLQLLAGLLDTDGCYDSKKRTFDLITKSKVLADTTAYLCRSLGFATTTRKCQKSSQTGRVGTYYRLHIGGNDLNRIPIKIARKVAMARPAARTNGRLCRDVLHTGYTLEPLGVDYFFGFTLDADGLYLLGDFTVTHNSGKGSALAAQPDLATSVAATWDAAGEQNATENEWVLEECRKRGIKPVFLFVHADPKKSWPGVIERAKGIGRMVDAQLFADSYAVGSKNFADFHKKHKDEASFVFGKFKGRGEPAEIVDEMPKEALELDAQQIYEFASQYTDEKKSQLPDFVYDGATIGRRAWAESA